MDTIALARCTSHERSVVYSMPRDPSPRDMQSACRKVKSCPSKMPMLP